MNNRLPESGSVLGVDIGFSVKRRSSAVCRLDWNANSVAFSIERFRALEPERTQVLRRAADRPVMAVAFDGPLRSDFGIIGHFRLAELLLTRRLWSFIGKPGQSSTPVGKNLNSSTNTCAKIVLGMAAVGKADHDHAIHPAAIAEAFPSSFLGLLIRDPTVIRVRRGNRSDRYYDHLAKSGDLDKLLHSLLHNRRPNTPFDAVKNHDDRAAVICALTALCVAAGEYTVVGDGDGWIVLPPPVFIQKWAWDKLAENAKLDGGLEWRGANPHEKKSG